MLCYGRDMLSIKTYAQVMFDFSFMTNQLDDVTVRSSNLMNLRMTM